ncbi:MAG: SAM-dependent DNA methyltransferase [Deltaproteobacteria bacterium]|jgi:hypothetical protein|nr:SAM-dependent DNA methyltransferase [Deltaproteobacteria bacterium]
MPTLKKTQRNILEAAVREARDLAEAGARAVLEYLGVAQASPPEYLDGAQEALRERLRLHGCQLGDGLDGESMRTTDRLAEEIAYEHWHRMLFARILAENGMLMYPSASGPVPVTLEDCADLAAEEGAADAWECAARYAARMLPQIFRVGSPVFDVVFPPEHRQGLEKVIASLPPEICAAQDTLGWVYQYWQSKRKDEVNASEVKIGARELPAVTQLFTESYMVAFLLDNSLGAWWAARTLRESDLATAGSEAELRSMASLPGVPLEYLRFVRDGDGPWTPAAGTFERWPDGLAEFRMLDPCCGSGHFLAAAFRMLVPMRMAGEGLSARRAVDAVLRDNIHGLELDRRCVEIAVFALAIAAWTYPEVGGYRVLPELNIACSGSAVGTNKDIWTSLANGDPAVETVLADLYGAFKDAPVLGSLIDPVTTAERGGLYRVDWDDVKPLLEKALSAEALSPDASDELKEAAVAAKGITEATSLLAKSYTLVATNVPYLTRGRQDERLMDLCAERYPEARHDLATIFTDRCMRLCGNGGTFGVVVPHNWLFLKRYRGFREMLLKGAVWHIVSRLGPGAFDSLSGEVVKALLVCLSRGYERPAHTPAPAAFGVSSVIRVVDVTAGRFASGKAKLLPVVEITGVKQAGQLSNPDCVVSLEEIDANSPLGLYADSLEGVHTNDITRFVLKFWEIMAIGDIWEYYFRAPDHEAMYSGRDSIILWEKGGGALAKTKSVRICGQRAWGKRGAGVAPMRNLSVSLYSGEWFDSMVAAIIPKNQADLEAIVSFVQDYSFGDAVRKFDKSLSVKIKTFQKIPFDISRWTSVARERFPNGLPAPYSDDPSQWVFHGHPCGSVVWDDDAKHTAHGTLRNDWTVLQVTVARLLGYRWPAELDPKMKLADEQREWVRRCDCLSKFVDRDGIVAIPAVKGEANAKDRLLDMLAASYGNAWSNGVMSRLLASADHADGDLESWLRDKFFAQHCRLFQNRPFIWQIWDGLRDGFSALVNCHKLDRRLLESLAWAYVGDWIARQTFDVNGGVEGAQTRLDAAVALQKRLEAILEGEAPYDIFVRWKSLAEQPLGWNPDVNDGVRLNIRPFMMPPDVGKKGAGLLRDRPNIKWDKDRGKAPESAPWYHLDGGDRINDRHLKRAEKENART